MDCSKNPINLDVQTLQLLICLKKAQFVKSVQEWYLAKIDSNVAKMVRGLAR